MPNIIFVAPFLLETTLRFVHATADLPGVKLGLVTQHEAEQVPADLRDKLAGIAPARDALDGQAIADAVRELVDGMGPVDRLLGALEELQVPLGQVRDALDIPGLSAEIARNFRDKARMKEVLTNAGLPCARHTRVTGLDEARGFAKEVGFPLIVKPTAGSGSRNTFRVEDVDQLEQALALGGDTPTMLEEFMTGQEFSFDSVMLGGKLIWFSSCHYSPGPLEVLEQPWIQWCVIIPREADSPDYEDITRVGAESLRALGLRDGLSHMEWFRREDGSVAISEVGVRPPGAQFVTLISFAHDSDLYKSWARLMVFDEFDPPDRPYAAGAAFLRGQGTGRVVAISGVEEVAREIGDLAVEVRLPPKGAPPKGTYDGDGYVIVRHPSTEVVRDALAKIVSTLRVELG